MQAEGGLELIVVSRISQLSSGFVNTAKVQV